MLKPMCQISSWVNIVVTSRYHSPSATPSVGTKGAGGQRPMSTMSLRKDDGSAWTAMNTATLIPIRILVTRCGSAATVPPARVRGREAPGAGPVAPGVRPAAQSGQWKPTEALTMQSGQMGRSQRVQRMPVSRSGWR